VNEEAALVFRDMVIIFLFYAEAPVIVYYFSKWKIGFTVDTNGIFYNQSFFIQLLDGRNIPTITYKYM
jgi:hypothetical protein